MDIKELKTLEDGTIYVTRSMKPEDEAHLDKMFPRIKGEKRWHPVPDALKYKNLIPKRIYRELDYFSGPVSDRAERIIIVCAGPSLRDFDWSILDGLDQSIKIMSVNYTLPKLPRADFWFTCDKEIAMHFEHKKEGCKFYCVSCVAEKIVLKIPTSMPDGVHIMDRVPNLTEDNVAEFGFADDQKSVTGFDSGFCAINLAIYMKAKKIAVLGFDCGGSENWCGDSLRPWLHRCGVKMTFRAAEQSREWGVEIVNGSMTSACHDWQHMVPKDAITWIRKD